MSTTLVNLTPHAVTLVDSEGTVLAQFAPVAPAARCAVTSQQVASVEVAGVQVPVYSSVMGEVQDLPAPEHGVLYIVSRIVAEACKGTRSDLLVPDKTVRNNDGQIVGCAGFAVV